MIRIIPAVIAAIIATSANATGTVEPPPQPWLNNQQAQQQSQKQAQQQGQSQSSSNRNDNSNANDNRNTNRNSSSANNSVNVDNSSRAAASSAIAGNVAGCMEGASASMQTFGWGVGVAKCRGDYYQQVVDAEDRALRGSRAGAIYLSHRDEGARVAFQQMGVVESSAMRRERKGAPGTPATAPDALWSVCEWRNGAPYVRVKAGRNVNAAVAQCMSYFRGAR